jgi:hypothetical protein
VVAAPGGCFTVGECSGGSAENAAGVGWRCAAHRRRSCGAGCFRGKGVHDRWIGRRVCDRRANAEGVVEIRDQGGARELQQRGVAGSRGKIRSRWHDGGLLLCARSRQWRGGARDRL